MPFPLSSFLTVTFVLLHINSPSAAGILPINERYCGPNNKIKITETTLEQSSAVDDYQIYFVSNNNQIVFIRTLDGQVFRSTDEGRSWEIQTVEEKMSKIKLAGGINSLFNTQVKDGTIALYFLGADYKSLWVSKDGGSTYSYWDTMPSNIYELYMHPMYPGLVMGKRRIFDKAELWLGTDFGKNWTQLASHLPAYSKMAWSIFPDTNPTRIYLLKYANPAKPDLQSTQLVYSEDYFKSEVVLDINNVWTWTIYEPNKFVVITCVDLTCDKKQLHISNNAGKIFNLVEIPERNQESKEEHDFYVWEITDEAIWVYVERSCTRSNNNCWGDIFHSNAADQDFTLSLSYNKKWEFTKFNSINGIYLANQYITRSGLPESGDRVRSLITFNKGSDWTILKAPPYDANGQETNCTIDHGCSLHVHGWGAAHSFTYFYSIPNAVGLMVASGNLGNRLEDRADQTNTYVSFNGGMDWKEVRKYTYIPEIGDSGAIVLLVREDGDTDEVVYTIDDGDEWHTCQFTPPDKLIDISNIRVAPGWNSRRFLMYGERVNNGVTSTVILQLNFDDELNTKCTTADFTTWSPKNEHGKCVLGRATYYNRRNRTLCYFGEDYVPIKKTETCSCTPDDYECDHCFYRTDLSSPCSLECPVEGLPLPPANCTGGYWPVDAGYRLVDNDGCRWNDSASIKPKGLIPCLTTAPLAPPSEGGSTRAIVGVSVSLVSLVIVIGGAILYKKSERFHNFVCYTIGEDVDYVDSEQEEETLVGIPLEQLNS